MTDILRPNEKVRPLVGIVLLALTIGFLLFIGIHGMQVAKSLPDDNDQRDIEFYASIYNAISLIAFVLILPLIGLFVTQVVLAIKSTPITK